MKQFKKRKIKKRKKTTTESNIDEEIIPQKHQREGNLNFYSEEISKQIIEKIISNVISTNFYNNIEKKFNDFCIDEFFKKIDNLVELTHLDHETDDFNCSEEILSKIKYQKTDTNNNRRKIKIHKNIVEYKNHLANEVFFDNGKMLNKSFNRKNNVDLVKQNNILLHIEVKDDNFWGVIPQPKSHNIDRTTSRFNILTSKLDNSNKILEVENASMNKNNEKNKNVKYFLKRKSNIFLDKYHTNELLKTHKKYQPILQMIHISIPDEEFNKNEEGEEIKKLRKETIELITARQEELKKLSKKSKVKEPKKKIKIKKKEKGGNFAIDKEGKIVLLKQIEPESLLREFSPIMSKQKDISLGKSSKTIEKERLLLELKAKKHIEYNPDFFNFISNNNITDKLDKDNKEKEKEKEKNNNKRKSKNKTNVSNTNIIKEEISKYQPPPLMSLLSPRFTPSGSNFEIINPSIGVNIKEKDQIKVGGKNFYEKFHKFSIDEFNKTLHETLEMEIKSKLKGNILKDLNMNDIKNVIKEENNLGHIRSDIKDKKDKIFRKTFSGGFRARKRIQKSNSDFFNINEKYPVLKEILFHDNDVSNDRNRKIEKSLSNINIFNRNIKSSMGRIANKNIKKYEYNLLNGFNKELIQGKVQINERKPILPRLPPKIKINIVVNNLLNNNALNKTLNNFHRIRQKKNNDSVYDLSNPPSANKIKKAKMKRINSSNKVFN